MNLKAKVTIKKRADSDSIENSRIREAENYGPDLSLWIYSLLDKYRELLHSSYIVATIGARVFRDR